MNIICIVLGGLYLGGNYEMGKALAICSIILGVLGIIVDVCREITTLKEKEEK